MILDYRDRGKIGFTCSTFDLLHAGHITMLEEAKRQCDFLVVGLQNDPTLDRPDTKNSPVQTLVERQIQLSAVKYVDEVIVYNTEQDLCDLLLTLPIDVRILGVEYENTEFTGKDINCFFNKRDHSFSSTSLRKRISNLNGK
jgi:glycerol-3-phosphate cytidylyltransferase